MPKFGSYVPIRVDVGRRDGATEILGKLNLQSVFVVVAKDHILTTGYLTLLAPDEQ